MVAKEQETWNEYRRLVLAELERLHEEVAKIKEENRKRDIRQAINTTKLAVYATLASIAGGALFTFVVNYLTP